MIIIVLTTCFLTCEILKEYFTGLAGRMRKTKGNRFVLTTGFSQWIGEEKKKDNRFNGL